MSESFNKPKNPIVTLHLSDLHFGVQSRFTGRSFEELGARLGQAVRDEAKRRGLGERPDLVVVTGDVAQTAKGKEYEEARLFFESLNETLKGLPRSRFVFTPGNHDVSWYQCRNVENDKEEFDFTDKVFREKINGVKFRHFEKFTGDFLGKPRSETGRALARGAILHDFPDLMLSVAALNSCERESHMDEDHLGLVSKEQAQSLMDAWRDPKRENRIRIAALHHNPRENIPSEIDAWIKMLEEEKKKGALEKGIFKRFAADAVGLEGREHLAMIARNRQVSLFLHGHQHAYKPDAFFWKKNGLAHVISAGSLGLAPDKLPKDQPNQIQLIALDVEKREINAWSLVYNPLAKNDNFTDPGDFAPDNAGNDPWPQDLHLPDHFDRQTLTTQPPPLAPDLSAFYNEYRTKLSGQFAYWDLRGVGVTQSGGPGKPIRGSLEEMYVPLRLGEGFDINKLERGAALAPADLMLRDKPLAIRGNVGAGKTTWMRWTFRRLLDNETAFPIMIELRRLMRDWSEHPDQARNLETYMEKWIADFVGEKWRRCLSVALSVKESPRPMLLVDGWDELGDLGEELRSKLVGLMCAYPDLLVVVSSRPYGEGRPSNSEGFEVLDMQPLNDGEVKTLAGHFFTLCHPKAPNTQKEATSFFLAALERSAEAQALGRTALLLTMMLLISRTSPLPDKRHQLYQRCIENLLTTLPDHHEHEGVRKLGRQWRPEDGDERFREVANIAFQAQNEGYKEKGRGVIILKRGEINKMLPWDLWTAQQRNCFVNWLSERAGVLVDRTDDIFTFAHLSFQEYLTAWRMDADIEGREDRIKAFVDRAGDMNWWETLRLWGAVIESKNPNRLKPVLEKLIEGDDKFFNLAGAMLADGLGDEELFLTWVDRFVVKLQMDWSYYLDNCARAWATSRQFQRRKEMAERLESKAHELTLTAWMRFEAWMEEALSTSLSKRPIEGSNAQIVIDWLRAGREDSLVEERTLASGKTLCGGPVFWPSGKDGGFLHVWPGHRRLAGLRLQSLSNLKVEFGIFKSASLRILVKPPFDKKARNLSRDISWDFYRYFSHYFSRYLSRNLSRNLSRDFSRDFSRYFSRYFFRDFSCDMSRYLSRDISRYLSRYFSRDFSRGFSRFFSRDLSSDLSNDLSINFLNFFIRASTNKKMSKAENTQPFTDKNLPVWAFDFTFGELRSYGRVAAPTILAHIDRKLTAKDPIAPILAPACRLYCNPESDPTEFERELDRYPADGHPLWPALARHVARRTVTGDEDWTLLEDLAKHPEKTDPPLRWALKYIVRGDIRMDDGQIVTLDQLADDLGMERLPYLEPMPEHFEVDWDD